MQHQTSQAVQTNARNSKGTSVQGRRGSLETLHPRDPKSQTGKLLLNFFQWLMWSLRRRGGVPCLLPGVLVNSDVKERERIKGEVTDLGLLPVLWLPFVPLSFSEKINENRVWA